MKSHAKLKNLRVAPRKVRLLVDLIRGKRVEDALVQLQFSKKHAAIPVKKLLESAVANAVHNHQAIPESLVITTAFVDEGRILKRWMPRAMGRATPIRKRTSHITLVLEGQAASSTDTPATKKKEGENDETASSVDKQNKKETKVKTSEKKPSKKSSSATTKKKTVKKKSAAKKSFKRLSDALY